MKFQNLALNPKLYYAAIHELTLKEFMRILYDQTLEGGTILVT
jgi:hypothetical protein